MGRMLVHVLLFAFFFSKCPSSQVSGMYQREQAIFRVKSTEKYADGSVNVEFESSNYVLFCYSKYRTISSMP